jgi:hypothetical protein
MIAHIDQSARQTVLQYSLRGMFLATLAAAILSAIAAPFVRHWDSAHTLAFVNTASGVLIGSIGWGIWMCWLRYSVEQKCGALLLRLPMQTPRGRRWYLVLSPIGAMSLIGMDFVTHLRMSTPHWSFDWLAACAGMTLANFVLAIWWKGATLAAELCENGVILASAGFSNWTEFKGFRWTRTGRLQLVKRFAVIDLHAPSELRALTDELLRKHIPSM